MLESFSRGFRMIWASMKMGWSDKRLILPSVLSVFSQSFFCVLLVVGAYIKIPHQPVTSQAGAPTAQVQPMPTYGLIRKARPSAPLQRRDLSIDPEAAKEKIQQLVQMVRPNGQGDPNGFDPEGGGFGAIFTGDNALLLVGIGAVAWLINRMLEGVTTALVYSHLTEGKGTGRFGDAFKAVLCSLPAIVVLGIVTWISRRLATFFKKSRPGGVLGMSFNFVFSIVEIFWTMAGHLILPAIVIEGCSFWGGLKRADKIASGNLLTMGIGEVAVEGICRLATFAVMGVGTMGVSGAVYAYMQMHYLISPVLAGVAVVLWLCALVVTMAMSVYIKSAFYTCLYVWAIETEAVEETERENVRPPAPLAMALSS